MFKFDSESCHENLINNLELPYAFSPDKDFDAWRKELREKFTEVLGINKIKENACPLHYEIEYEELKDGYRLLRLLIETEKNMVVPCYLLIPTTGKEKYPIAITIQGHKDGGMYSSIGIVKTDDDREYQPRGSFALQAVEHGFAALCVEMRGMGELEPSTDKRNKGFCCRYTNLVATSLGRSVLGERVWDVSRSIDVLEQFPELDTSTIVITGNSGGGTASFYSACYDERITLSAPSCAFCNYKESILHWFHCLCNVIPNAPLNFEMGDLAGLIAPRKLMVIAGIKDDVFPYNGVMSGYAIAEKVYAKAGVSENLKLVTTPKHHYWCEDIVWPNIKEFLKSEAK